MINQVLVPDSTRLYTLDRTPAHPRPLQFRSPCESMGFRVSAASNSVYIAYLDEFGHVGPFVSRSHARHNTSPVFGLGGIVLPVDRIRAFASFFYRLKCDLLAFEIERAGVPACQWEKKGSSLYTTENVLKYRELRHATARLLNRIERENGMVFYVGVEKARSSDEHDSKRLYREMLTEAILGLNDFCDRSKSMFMTVFDEQHDAASREAIVSDISREMFGGLRLQRMIEPPVQVESHLFQTLQCADWMCGLVGRASSYLVAPAEYEDLFWVTKYFGQRLARVAPISAIRRLDARIDVAEPYTKH